MATTTKLDHISHEHPLILIDDFNSSSIAAPLVCCLCETPIIGLSPAYTCSQEHSPCSFFLHKRCADESPKHIRHLHNPEHLLELTNEHPPSLIKNILLGPNDEFYISCAACTRKINLDMWVYACGFCKFDWRTTKSVTSYPFVLCVRCVVMESVLDHEGHEQHPLTLLCRRACFTCDACGTESAEFGSYTCLTCQFWIHSCCAAYPQTIKLQIHEDDTLQLIYSIPDMYRRFIRHCPICRNGIKQKNWAYYCEESGYFVHIMCAAALLASGKNVIEIEDDDEQTYSDMMQFPLPSTDSLMANLVAVHQSGKPTQNNTIVDAADNEKEGRVINHWSHPKHPLILLEEFMSADNSGDDSDEDDRDTNTRIDEMLVCNGCVQPISPASNKYYYGCIGCNFFLHTTCANHLPLQSPPGICLGKCTPDPKHTFKLDKYAPPIKSTICKACWTRTNGFTYECDTCPSYTNICVCCCVAPHRIKHEYHKHPLVQCYATSKKTCNACLKSIGSGFEYRCETCSDIQIHQNCALKFPKTVSHRWDSHSISLIYPPIYYKGLRYCEICELEVNQEAWLYRCTECDQCFHPLCIRQPHNVKLGITVDPSTHKIHRHTLTLKMIDKDRYPERIHRYISCRKENCFGNISGVQQQLYLECAGCSYLICFTCSHELNHFWRAATTRGIRRRRADAIREFELSPLSELVGQPRPAILEFQGLVAKSEEYSRVLGRVLGRVLVISKETWRRNALVIGIAFFAPILILLCYEVGMALISMFVRYFFRLVLLCFKVGMASIYFFVRYIYRLLF